MAIANAGIWSFCLIALAIFCCPCRLPAESFTQVFDFAPAHPLVQRNRLSLLGTLSAPNHRLREPVTPAKRGRRGAAPADESMPARHVSMTPDQVLGRLWAQRLKRVFKIDIETCDHCGGESDREH